GNPHNNIDDKGYWDSGCSWHITGNISYLSEDYASWDLGQMHMGRSGLGVGTVPVSCRTRPLSDDGKKVDEDPRKESECNDNEKEDNLNNTNNVNTAGNVNTASLTVNAAGTNEVNVVGGKINIELPFDPKMPALEDDSIFNFSSNDEDDGAVADMNNLDTTIKALNGFSGIKNDEKGIMIRNKARLVAQGYTQEERIDYDEVFAHVARIKAIRLFLAYASFKDFVVYQMDVKSDILYEKIEEEVYVCQPSRFEDPDFLDRVYKVEKALYGLHQAPRAWHKGNILVVQVYMDDIIFGLTKKKLCIAFEKLMHEKFQMSSMEELTFFLGLQKFGFTEVKTASTPMETQQPLLKDEDGEEVDVHIYRYQVNPKVSHLHVVKRIFRYFKDQSKLGLWYPKDSPFDLVAYTDSDYARASLDRKSYNRRKPKRKDTQVPQPSDPIENVPDEAAMRSWVTICPWCQETMGDTSAQTRFESLSKHSSDSLLARGNTLQSDEDSLKLNELMVLYTTLQNRVLVLEKTTTTQHNDMASLKRRIKKLEKKNRMHPQGRIDAIDADEEITLDSVHDEVNVVEVVKVINTTKLIIDAAQDTAAGDIVNTASVATTVSTATTTTATIITVGDITLAQAIKEIKSTKPKEKGIDIQELEHVIKPVKPIKRKNQIRLDEEAALKLQAAFDEEERLAREKAKKVEEANMEDLEDLYKLVKAKYESTRPVEDLDLLLWGDLKSMFEPHVEDEV
nr:hypothetical protein [Tanacetum cinerariifolium]